jgi:hypothetical protein
MHESSPSLNVYLKADRLADVLTLIQVLAYGETARRTAEGLEKELQRNPLTANTWIDLGKQHPEFFRVFNPPAGSGNKQAVTLVARFVLKPIPASGGDAIHTPLLSAEVTTHLMDLALQLHDREVQRRDRWKAVLAPMVVAIIAAVASITAAVTAARISGAKCPPCNPAVQSSAPTTLPPR